MNKVNGVLIACILVIAFFALSMQTPAPEANQYIIVQVTGMSAKFELEQLVTAKLEEGWHLQGGVNVEAAGYSQAMYK